MYEHIYILNLVDSRWTRDPVGIGLTVSKLVPACQAINVDRAIV